MQTTLLGLAIAFILALVAALVGPYFVDWNQFRPQFEAEATRVVGAPVRVRGALDARLLPSPSLRLSSITVGSPNDLGRIRADKLDVEFSLSALMRGEWRATELSIGGAAVDLGLNAKGRVDLPASTGPFNLGALSIDRLNVTGRIALHDAASKSTLELNDIAFSGDVRSLATGALRGDGNVLLSGMRYPFRISSGQTSDGNGTRVRLTVDPGDKPLSIDIDGILNFDNRVPRFEGALAVARPAPPKSDTASARGPSPWRVSAKVKIDPSAARMESLEASYGADETALKVTGLADIAFGASPQAHAVVSAKQLDVDRHFSKEAGAGDPVGPFSALRQLISAAPQPPIATRIEVGADQIMLGGRPVQNLATELRNDGAAWIIDQLEFRAPGSTRVALSGGAQTGVDTFRGALSVESSDPDALASWLKGRSDVNFRNQKPLRIRGTLDAAADRVSLDGLNAEVDGGTVQGRVAYVYPTAAGGSSFDAELKADRLDIDAATALLKYVGGPQGAWPDSGQLSLDIGRAISAGQEVRPFVAQFGYSPKILSLDRFKVGDATSLMLEGSGTFDRIDATGRLAISASSASMSQIRDMVAPLAPSLAARLGGLTPASGPVRAKLALDLAKDMQHADHATARAVLDIDAPQLKGTTTLTASPAVANLRSIDLDALSRSDVTAESRLSGSGQQILALLGLGGIATADEASVDFEGSVAGSLRAPLRIKAKLSGADLDADMQGSAEPWATPAKAGLTLAIRRANLAPLLDLKSADMVAQNIALSSRVTLNGDKLSFEDIDSTLAGSRMRGRVAMVMGAERTVDGQLGMDRIDLAPALALMLGIRGRDATDPLGRGLLQGWRGKLSFEALQGALPGGPEIRSVSGVVRSDGQLLSVDAIKGKVGGGQLTADMDVKPSLTGYALGARIKLSDADGAALRYRSLSLPAGKVSLQMTLSSQGRSASALQGAVSGSGFLMIDGARIAGLDPHVFDTAIRASDTGQATDDTKLRQIVDNALSAGTLSVASAQIPFGIKDSRLRVDATTLDAGDARAVISGGYDMMADQADLRATLSSTAAGASKVRPEIQIFATGTPDQLTRTVDIASLSSWLAVRAIDRETRRLDALERGDPPQAAVPIAIPPAATPPAIAPQPAPIDGSTSSAPTQSDIPLPGPDPRRPPAKASTPRVSSGPATIRPPVISQQVAPLPAPIEVRPAPGVPRAVRPRPSAPLVLTPQ